MLGPGGGGEGEGTKLEVNSYSSYLPFFPICSEYMLYVRLNSSIKMHIKLHNNEGWGGSPILFLFFKRLRLLVFFKAAPAPRSRKHAAPAPRRFYNFSSFFLGKTLIFFLILFLIEGAGTGAAHFWRLRFFFKRLRLLPAPAPAPTGSGSPVLQKTISP